MLGGRLITHDIYKKNYDVREYNYLMMMILKNIKRLSDEGGVFRVYSTDRFHLKIFQNQKLM